MKIVEFTISEITKKEGYCALFKAFVAVSVLYLVSLIQVTNIALPIEIEAHKAKFIVEKELGEALVFDDLVCDVAMKSYVECRMATHQIQLSGLSLNGLKSFQELLMFLSIVFGGVSIFGFLLHPYVHENEI